MPDDHHLTREELEAQLKQTSEALEVMEDKEEPEEKVVDEPSQPQEEESQEQEVVDEPVEEEEIVEEEEKVTPVDTKEERAIDEVQKLNEDKKKINSAFIEANNLPEPTDQELKSEYTDWELMSDTEKRLAKDNLANRRRFEVLAKADEQRVVVEEWNDKVDEFIDNPKTLNHNPELEGKQTQFKEYAKDKTRRMQSMDLILKSFLYDVSKSQVKHTGKMLETGQGGDKKIMKPRDDKISVQESVRIRNSDYNEYVRLLKAGKIRTEIE